MSGSCTLGAVGDIVVAAPVDARLREHGAGWLLERVAGVLAGADLLVGNLESPIAPAGAPLHGLATHDDGTAALERFDVLSLANNHVLDAGTDGLLHTRALVEARGIVASGAGETQAEARALRVVERGGLRVGFLSYAEDSNYTLSTAGPCHAYYEPESVLADIASSRPQVDALVVSVHADLEFMDTPAPRRRDAFRRFAGAGATLVLGHHPHVPQGVERVGTSLVAYSLGNFAFDAHGSSYLRPHLPRTAWSFVLLAELTPAGVAGFTRVPVVLGGAGDERPAPAEGEEAASLARHLEQLDALAADDAAVAARWREEALRRLVAQLPPPLDTADRAAVLHALGTLLHVAENRAWVDEVAAAVSEAWQEQRARLHPDARPAASAPPLPHARRPLARRAARRARRAISRRFGKQ